MSSTRNRQIIKTLCSLGTVTQAQLLPRLQSIYPNTGWTAALLASDIALGQRQGRYSVASQNPTRYRINKLMVQVYPQNQQYQDLCNTIVSNFPCETVITSNVTTDSEPQGFSVSTVSAVTC